MPGASTEYVINPSTGRVIKRGGRVYKKWRSANPHLPDLEVISVQRPASLASTHAKQPDVIVKRTTPEHDSDSALVVPSFVRSAQPPWTGSNAHVRRASRHDEPPCLVDSSTRNDTASIVYTERDAVHGEPTRRVDTANCVDLSPSAYTPRESSHDDPPSRVDMAPRVTEVMELPREQPESRRPDAGDHDRHAAFSRPNEAPELKHETAPAIETGDAHQHERMIDRTVHGWLQDHGPDLLRDFNDPHVDFLQCLFDRIQMVE